MYNDRSLVEGPNTGPRRATRVDPGGAWLELLPHAPAAAAAFVRMLVGSATIARRPLNTNHWPSCAADRPLSPRCTPLPRLDN